MMGKKKGESVNAAGDLVNWEMIAGETAGNEAQNLQRSGVIDKVDGGVNVMDVAAARDGEIEVVNFDDKPEDVEQKAGDDGGVDVVGLDLDDEGVEWDFGDEVDLGGDELRKELSRENAEKMGEAALEAFMMDQVEEGVDSDLMAELADAAEREMVANEGEDVFEDMLAPDLEEESSAEGEEQATNKIIIETGTEDYGEWGDPRDEYAEWAEAHPVLAERMEGVAQEYGVNVNTLMRGLMTQENVEEAVDGYSDENLAKMAAMLNVNDSVAGMKGILQKRPDEIDRMFDDFGQWEAKFTQAKENRWRYGQILGTFVRYYDERKVDTESLERVGEMMLEKENDPQALYELETVVTSALRGAGLKEMANYLPFWDELRQEPENERLENLSNGQIVGKYFRNHGMDAEKERGFRENVFPNLEKGEPETEVIRMASNSWGMEYGDYGIADWACQCLVSEVSPKNTCDLLLGMRELPTVDRYKFEQNRMDALALQDTVIGSRDFIHDERPGVHELLETMLDYYDSRNEETHFAKKIALEDVIAERMNSADRGYYDRLPERAMDLGNYEKIVQRQVYGKEYNETAAEILRRLVKNTDQEMTLPPATKDEYLNGLMANTELYQSPRTMEITADIKQVGELLGYMNQQLQGLQGNLGMWPSMMKAVAWTERVATYAMRGISAKEWRELPWDANFREIIKFQNFTMCKEKFNEDEFEEFWQKMRSVAAEDYPKNVEKGYTMLQLRVAEQMGRLGGDYVKQGMSRRATALRSGNLVHELIMLPMRNGF